MPLHVTWAFILHNNYKPKIRNNYFGDLESNDVKGRMGYALEQKKQLPRFIQQEATLDLAVRRIQKLHKVVVVVIEG
jgi:hypothetical protein